MGRSIAAKIIVIGTALAAASVGGTYAATADEDDAATTTVLNKNGHEVNEHAAKGQARAAEARAQRDAPTEEPVEGDDESGDPTTTAPDPAPAPGPDVHAGDHPNENATTHGQGAGSNGKGKGKAPRIVGADRSRDFTTVARPRGHRREGWHDIGA